MRPAGRVTVTKEASLGGISSSSVPTFVEKLRILTRYLTTPSDDRGTGYALSFPALKGEACRALGQEQTPLFIDFSAVGDAG